MTKASWFAVLCDYEGGLRVVPCDSYETAYQTGMDAMNDGFEGVAIDGFHVTLSAGYWK